MSKDHERHLRNKELWLDVNNPLLAEALILKTMYNYFINKIKDKKIKGCPTSSLLHNMLKHGASLKSSGTQTSDQIRQIRQR